MRKRQYGSEKLKIEFHRTYLLMALGFVLTGYYLNLLVFTSLILIHELGHYLMARVNRFHVTKIIIYPYGGLTKIEDMVNRSIDEELLIAASGVIIQYLFYLGIGFLFSCGYIRLYTYKLYTLYNSQMIFFNLLPIYPLDGGKILNLLLSKIFPYNKANEVTVVVSSLIIFLIIGGCFYTCSYSNIMVMGLMIFYLYKFYSNRKYLYKRFLLERYLYGIEYPRVKKVRGIDNLFKDRSHLIRVNNHYLKEGEVLSILFRKK